VGRRFRKLISYYRPYRRLLLADLACASVVAGTTLLLPLGIRYITRNVLEGGMANPQAHIYGVGALMLALIAVHTACNYFVDYRGHAMGAMMETDMRRELFAHYQRLSFRFHDSQVTGQLMSRITHDLLSLTELYHHAPEDLVINTVRFVGATAILLSINARLALAVLAFLPLMGVYILRVSRWMHAALRENRQRVAEVNAQVEDSLAGIRVVQSFANEAEEQEKFDRANGRFLASRTRTYRAEAVFSQGMETSSQLLTAAVAVFGGVAIAGGSLGLPDLITFLLYIGNLIQPLRGLAHTVQQYQEGITGFERFMEILDIAPDIQDAPHARDLAVARGDIAFQKVGFRYHADHQDVLKDVCLEIRAGDHVALVGSSGVGKTTLCSLIPRFYDASEGRVLIDGVDVRDITLRSLRRQVGIVQQDVYLFAGTVWENIRYGKPDATDEEIIAAARRANAHTFIERLPQGYHTDIGQRGVRLSGGQRQRLSVARVFLKDPPILILDEATSALDDESERAVQESLEALARGRTTIVIAHRLSTIRRARRVLALTDRGIEETRPDVAAREGAYADLRAL
jgi:ATP-binding cassette subfamily B protein